MRRLIVCFLLAAVVRAGDAAQNDQRPPDVFRGNVDLVTIDVSATDSRNRPVDDLKPGDFTVRVDGKPRPVVSAEFIRADRAKPAAPPKPGDAFIASNISRLNARRIIVAVDQTLITPGMLAPLLRTTSDFVDRLAPQDYAAFIGFPEPGPRVDFTTDKTVVRKAMQSLNIGQPAKERRAGFDMSLYEAYTITGAESIQDKTIDQPMGPVMQLVFARVNEQGGCADFPANVCRGIIYNEAETVASEARTEGKISLQALEALLKDLVALDGAKTMVVFSAGLVNEDPSRLDDLARLAAAARTTINVIAVDRDRNQLTSESNRFEKNSIADRSFELEGLEGIADRTNGTLFRGIAAGAGIFKQLESELSAWYVVAVERQPGDAEQMKLDVDVKRRGVTLHSNKSMLTAAVRSGRSIDELLSDALSSPFTLPGLPLRISTFTQHDADSRKYRLRIAADVGPPGEPAGEFGLGYVLTNERGRVVTSAGSRRTLSPEVSGPGAVLRYDTALSVEPGSYALRVAAVDRNGRRGAVVSRIDLPKLTPGEVGISDLIVGNLPAEGETLSPHVEPLITASELAGYLELYPPENAGDFSVALEIAEGEGSPALATGTMTIRPGDTPTSRVATGSVATNMTPGRYLARAVVKRNGMTWKTLTRPITIVRDPTVVTRAATRPKGVPIARDLQYRTAAYIAGVVNGLANVVAQEDFELSKPNRRVTSDLLLVRYPGSVRDLIPYRDVAQLNGAAIAGREERLLDLFVKPTDAMRERARRIMIGAEAYVPSVFNPIFVIGFLQSDFQSRFELTVNDAGSDWPREVKAVTFVEAGRPTLLRTGAFGDFDAPSRGTAWIEEGTGRILQTELQVGRGKGIPTMVTKFKLDDRLQVMVPVEMKTENPDGRAVYSNFRRFEVATETAIPTPPAAR